MGSLGERLAGMGLDVSQHFLPRGKLSTSLLALIRLHLIALVATIAFVVASDASFPQTLVLAFSSPDMHIGNVLGQGRIRGVYLAASMPAALEIGHFLFVIGAASLRSRLRRLRRVASTRFTRRGYQIRSGRSRRSVLAVMRIDSRYRGIVVLSDIQQAVRGLGTEMLLEQVFEDGACRIERIIILYRDRRVTCSMKMLRVVLRHIRESLGISRSDRARCGHVHRGVPREKTKRF